MNDPDFEPKPVIGLRLRHLWRWEQENPGGCRCVCGIYHPDTDENQERVCLVAADPGHLIRIHDHLEAYGPLPVCRPCYTSAATTFHASTEESPGSHPHPE